MEQQASTELFNLQIDHQGSAYLNETAKWAKFLAIVGFVICGLILLLALFAGSILASMMGRFGGGEGGFVGGAFLSVIYIGVALLYFFPCLYLYHFASKVKTAIRTNDSELLTVSFRNLKSCYRFIGILMIVMLSFYLILIIFGIAMAGLSSR